ncbi:NADPH-dependent FMN reductase [Candidatus Uhrbacteria bacterium]|nr:NADPH-dependent FMN reductase [Candidatus Uhrbacteria bacterium]MBD3284184.1 NADPH-dependent FMN reductase [Candidatus Uhrbacteria bacterium]
MKLNIPILLMTMRDGAVSDQAAQFVQRQLVSRGVESVIVDPEDYHEKKSFEQEHVQPWSEIMKAADALVIVSPEYNHSMPGPGKEMLDTLYEEYEKKPVAICGVSSGTLGGARVIEHLKTVMIELKMVAIREAMYFAKARELFNEDGTIKDASYEQWMDKMFTELFWYAHVLKAGREGKIDVGL